MRKREDPRELQRGEKVWAVPHSAADWLLPSDARRSRADARRQIEGLSQNDQIIALLTELLVEQRRTNQLLEWQGPNSVPRSPSPGQ